MLHKSVFAAISTFANLRVSLFSRIKINEKEGLFCFWPIIAAERIWISLSTNCFANLLICQPKNLLFNPNIFQIEQMKFQLDLYYTKISRTFRRTDSWSYHIPSGYRIIITGLAKTRKWLMYEEFVNSWNGTKGGLESKPLTLWERDQQNQKQGKHTNKSLLALHVCVTFWLRHTSDVCRRI